MNDTYVELFLKGTYPDGNAIQIPRYFETRFSLATTDTVVPAGTSIRLKYVVQTMVDYTIEAVAPTSAWAITPDYADSTLVISLLPTLTPADRQGKAVVFLTDSRGNQKVVILSLSAGTDWVKLGNMKWLLYNLGAAEEYHYSAAKQIKELADHHRKVGGGYVYNFDDPVTDAAIYGDLYQWGRHRDGHEKRDTLNKIAFNVDSVRYDFTGTTGPSAGYGTAGQISSPNHKSKFVFQPDSLLPRDWHLYQGRQDSCSALWGDGRGYVSPQTPVRTMGDPCPLGYHVPTRRQLFALLGRTDTFGSAVNGPGTEYSADGYEATFALGETYTWYPVKQVVATKKITVSAFFSHRSPGGFALFKGSKSDLGFAEDTVLDDEQLAKVVFFLPAAGGRDYKDGAFWYAGSECYYWSSTVDPDTGKSYHLYVHSDYNTLPSVHAGYPQHRGYGFSVRCVAEL